MISIVQATPDTAVMAFYESTRYQTAGGDRPLRLRQVPEGVLRGWFFGTHRYTFAAMDGERMVGLASGAYRPEAKTGYLSYFCVAPAYRGQGIATHLMDELERVLSACPDCEKLDAVFHNPVTLPWYVNQKGDHHPCVPGIDVSSGLYIFLKNRGWRDFAMQNAYYRSLESYRDPPDMAEKRVRLFSQGIELTMYDPARHYGLAELFDNINNLGWKAQVMANIHRPIVVAVDHGAVVDGKSRVVAYTGPLTVNEGRGVFCGIGTRTEYRGRGIGKLVFCEMCRRQAEGGATFMSLYTGENNPARNIYEAAGFSIVRSFANMRKALI